MRRSKEGEPPTDPPVETPAGARRVRACPRDEVGPPRSRPLWKRHRVIRPRSPCGMGPSCGGIWHRSGCRKRTRSDELSEFYESFG